MRERMKIYSALNCGHSTIFKIEYGVKVSGGLFTLAWAPDFTFDKTGRTEHMHVHKMLPNCVEKCAGLI